MFPDIIRRYSDIVQQLVDYEKLEIEVKQFSGYDFTVLRELFAKGYTLTPPEPKKILLAEAVELAEEDDTVANQCSECEH